MSIMDTPIIHSPPATHTEGFSSDWAERKMEEDFIKIEKELDKLAEWIMKTVVKKIFVYMCQISPSPSLRVKTGDAEYSMGSYVMSHRIAIGMPEGAPPTYTESAQKSAVQHALKELNRLQAHWYYDRIYIFNEIPWAQEVEYGWPGPHSWGKAKHEPYAVYARAAVRGTMYLQNVIGETEFITIGQGFGAGRTKVAGPDIEPDWDAFDKIPF